MTPNCKRFIYLFLAIKSVNTLLFKNIFFSFSGQKLVQLAASKGHVFPANLLWMEYILVGKDKEADLIWNQALSSANVVVFRRLLQECYVRKDTKPVEKVISALKTNKNLPSATIANAYSRLIDILVLNNKTNEAKSAYEDALSYGITKDEINKNTLQRLNIFDNSSDESKSL